MQNEKSYDSTKCNDYYSKQNSIKVNLYVILLELLYEKLDERQSNIDNLYQLLITEDNPEFALNNFKQCLKRINNKEKYIGSDEVWDKAESAIIEAASEKGLNTVVEYGEAAFYGPKLDIQCKNVFGKFVCVSFVVFHIYMMSTISSGWSMSFQGE